MKPLVGLSIGDLQNKYGDHNALSIAVDAGADAVDFDTSNSPAWAWQEPASIYSRGDAAVEAYFTGLRQHADSLGLLVSQTHGRLSGYVGNPERDAATLENARLDLLAAKVIGAPVCVIHSVSTSRVGALVSPEAMRALNIRMYTDILPYARLYGVQAAMETFGDSPGDGVCDFFGQAKELLASYEAVASIQANRQWLSLCADTGHSNKAMRFGQPSPGDVIRLLGSRVNVLHLNDNDSLTDQHGIPLTGRIDWEDVLSALDEIDYHGVYNMELNLGCFGETLMADTAAFAVKVMKQMLTNRHGNV